MALSFSLFIFMRMLFLLSQLNLILPLSTPFVQPLCHHDESSALLQFKESFIIDEYASISYYDYDPNCEKVASWTVEGDKSDCCSWDGVECDEATGHVIGLDLSFSCLYGFINSNSSLFRLVHLQSLNLAYNDFNNSQIPSQVHDLSRLTHLNLSMSQFAGQIPVEISRLSHLISLDLSDNSNLELEKHSLRRLVGNLTHLQKLDLSWVNISSTVPNILANLSSLTFLSLVDCGLHGEFPMSIFKLPNLRHLNVANNKDLTGFLPGFKWSSPLEILELGGSSFSGELPASMGNLGFLNRLYLQGCNFSGSIPSSLGNLTKLTFLDLTDNTLVGNIPPSIGNLTKLSDLYLYENALTGNIPPSIGNLTKLSVLHLSENAFVGNIPHSLGNLVQLSDLHISNNQLTGPIPFELLSLPQLLFLVLSHNLLSGFELRNETQLTSPVVGENQLTWLDISNNQLTGPIPFELLSLPRLRFVDLSHNLLSGFELRNETQLTSPVVGENQLTRLNLSANKLRGQIPNSVFNLKNLETLNLSNNYLTGIVEFDEFVTLKNLTTLDISGNQLSEFPNFLRNQHELDYLNLSNNTIHGHVPEWMWNTSITSLQFLDLSNNLLTGFGRHPIFLRWTSLKYLDLRSNSLQGSLPIPPVSTSHFFISNNSFTGNMPELFCNLSSLIILDLANNNLSGSLPRCLDNFEAPLSVLDLRKNKFQGSIPDTWIRRSPYLTIINFSQNKFQGRLPRSLAECTMLKVFDISDNQFNDRFPFWLGDLLNLEVLILRSNNFNGPMETSQNFYKFLNLRILDISNNDFMGKLPLKLFENWKAKKIEDVQLPTYIQETSYFYVRRANADSNNYEDETYAYSMIMTNKGKNMFYEKVQELFTAIDFSSNKFLGEIPKSIGNLKGALLLNLSNNNLTGHIPSSLGSLTELEALDLSQNKFSGEIPHQLTQLTFLEVFNVSHNNLVGPIPQGKQFDTFEKNSFEGNPGLCGRPLTKKCGNSNESPSQPSIFEASQDSVSSFEFGWKIVVIGYGFGFAVGIIIGLIVFVRKHDWLMKTLRIRPLSGRRRRN